MDFHEYSSYFFIFHNHKNKFKIKFVSNLNDVNHLRYSLDRKEDLKIIQEIFSRTKKRPILKNDILELFSKNPKFFDINKHFDPNEGQIQSLKYDIKSS